MKFDRVVGFILLAVLSGDVRSDFSLQGSWRSNSELTIQSIKSVRELSRESLEAYERMFGNMTLEFSDKDVVVDHKIPGAKALSYAYRIISQSKTHITVEYGDPRNPEERVDYLIEAACIKRKMPGDEWFEYWCRVE